MKKTTDTEDKFNEALYFFDRMIEERKNEIKFKYNLSAFLSAFRSISGIMVNEFNSIDGFKSWHQKRVNDNFWYKKGTAGEFLRLRRVDTVHLKILSPDPKALATITETIGLYDSIRAKLYDKDGNYIGRYDFNTGKIIKDTTEEKIKENDDEKVTELKSNIDSPTNNVKNRLLMVF